MTKPEILHMLRTHIRRHFCHNYDLWMERQLERHWREVYE